MITESTVYWITRLDEIKHVISSDICFICIVILFISAMTMVIIKGMKIEHPIVDINTAQKIFKILRWLIFTAPIILIISTIAGAFIPTTQEMAAIKIIPAIANSQFVQKELPAESKELYEMAKSYIKKQLEVKGK